MDNLNVEVKCRLCGKSLGYSDREQVAYCADHSLDEINPPSWNDIRRARNEALAACDYTQLPDTPISAEKKAEWATYRQALRDLPQIYAAPTVVEWPDVPA
jgi:hypothetical protein